MSLDHFYFCHAMEMFFAHQHSTPLGMHEKSIEKGIGGARALANVLIFNLPLSH